MYKYLLFDLDGTLTKSERGIFNCIKYALEWKGMPVPSDEELRCFIGPSLYDSFTNKLGMEDALAKEMVAKYRERYNIIGLFENEVYDGVTEALTELKKRGVILAVATSKPTEPTLKILDKFNLSQYFDVVCGSNPDGTGSEKKYIIQKVLKRLNTEYGRSPGGADSVRESTCTDSEKDSSGTDSVKDSTGADSVKDSSAGKGATDTAMVGDRYYDIEGGKACGLETIGVLYGYGNRKELEEAGATHIVESLPDIVNI